VPRTQPLVSLVHEVRTRLQDNLVFSPRDYIRHPAEFLRADRVDFINELTRELDARDDLRFVYLTEQGELAVFARRLPWDSEFFGYQVARLDGIFPLDSVCTSNDYDGALETLLELANDRAIKYLFAPVASEDLALIRALGDHRFTLIETRVNYHMSLAQFNFHERYPVRGAYSSDIPILQRTARQTVNPFDRFHSDPYIAICDSDRMMEEWISASIERGFADFVLVPDVDQPEAFTTILYHRDRWKSWGGYKVAQTVLTAVAPAFRGWHRKLVAETNWHLKSLGIDHAILPTQITNRAVIHNLEQLGYQFGRAEHIFRKVL
jgi:hypothetical protein